MNRLMKKELEDMEIKRITEQKYLELQLRQREQITLKSMNKLKKQEAMRRLHERIQFERKYKTEVDQLIQKQEKILLEKEFDQKKLIEQQKKRDIERQKELDKRAKEHEFKLRT
jgi:hypothetical protein